ncbi:hypothetical protein DCN14_34315 [Burkholderia sp. IDO3]|nr:hypothetical protein DCN14_34315 [Burkholderia sp. IDO3]
MKQESDFVFHARRRLDPASAIRRLRAAFDVSKCRTESASGRANRRARVVLRLSTCARRSAVFFSADMPDLALLHKLGGSICQILEGSIPGDSPMPDMIGSRQARTRTRAMRTTPAQVARARRAGPGASRRFRFRWRRSRARPVGPGRGQAGDERAAGKPPRRPGPGPGRFARRPPACGARRTAASRGRSAACR